MKPFISSICSCIGICLLTGAFLLFLQIHRPVYSQIRVPVSHVPVRLSIPHLGIDTMIFPGKITHKTWEMTKQGVSYLVSSPLPGEKGNSILYGHNFPSILGNLPQAKTGETVTIIFGDGKRKEFTIVYTAIISPEQIHILSNTSDRRLTIFTCTGWLDSQRFVVVAMAN